MNSSDIRLNYVLPVGDFLLAGEASSNVKKKLSQLGISPRIVKRTAVAMYEAELNAIIHAFGGRAEVEITEDFIAVEIVDEGSGIPDIELAMTEGYSTASDEIREMGFGAGMGLPNIKRNADEFSIESEVGKGTKVRIVVYFKDP